MKKTQLKKLILFIALLQLTNTTIAMDTASWLSPSYYANLMNRTYTNIRDRISSSWAALQKNLAAKTLTTKQLTTKYNTKISELSKNPITNAEKSAQKLKNAIKKAIDIQPAGIMNRFKDKLDTFLLGASSSSYQFEGGLDENNASARFYKQQGLPTADKAIDFWHRYKDNIKQMKDELGINSFRISIAWDRVEPEQGAYNQEAINTYVDIIKTLKANQIEPIVVLHHYTVPTWFEDLGGFEKEENNVHFVNFALKMYDALHQDATYWSTFNAIEGYAFKGYFRGDGAPGRPEDKGNMELVAHVMLNMLKAHVKIYKKIKANNYSSDRSIPNPQVGIQKNIVLLDPSDKTLWHYCLSGISGICTTFGRIIQNKGFYGFLTKGRYTVWIPGKVDTSYYDKEAKGALDWIGVNVYSNMHLFLSTPQQETDLDRQTANPTYRDYPEGIYRAIKEIYKNVAKPLAIPIIITENGIATDDNSKRTRFFQRTLYTIRKLIEEGYPIIGYTPWASHDNYEWPSKEQPDAFTSRRYGFFDVNFDKNSPDYLKRTLKPGAYYYRDFIRSYFAP